MPRERRARVGAHQPSAKLSKRQFAVQDDAVETVEIGTATPEVSGQEILESLNQQAAIVTKKVKQRLKHEAFIDRVTSSSTPYSKAQRRRFNRRQREKVGGGLDSIEEAISTLAEKKQTKEMEDTQPTHRTTRHTEASKGAGVIGEGKGVPLTKAQRKRALELEKLRHPLILENPQYATNPFQTIRIHAQNTLEQHKPPSS